MADWLKAGNNAVITGGASGIGLASARYYLSIGMHVLIADLAEAALEDAKTALSDAGEGVLHTQVCDVSDFAQVQTLCDTASKLGNVHCLMNNAGAALPPSLPAAGPSDDPRVYLHRNDCAFRRR